MATIGRAEKGETADVNYMEVLLDLKPQDEWPTKASYAALGREMQEFLEAEVPTAVFSATQPVQMRVEELISGVRATLALKVYGANTPGVLNASMGFNDETLEPTYVLRTGAPGKSAGLDIATRLGLPQRLIERARSAMSCRPWCSSSKCWSKKASTSCGVRRRL